MERSFGYKPNKKCFRDSFGISEERSIELCDRAESIMRGNLPLLSVDKVLEEFHGDETITDGEFIYVVGYVSMILGANSEQMHIMAKMAKLAETVKQIQPTIAQKTGTVKKEMVH